MLADGSGVVASGGGAPKSAPTSAPRLQLAADGGGRARPVAEREYAVETVALNGPRLAMLEDIAALAAEKRDIKMKHAIENSIRLVRMQEGRIEISLIPGAAVGITTELSAKLTEWTGKRWFVALSDQKGEATLAEAAALKKNAMKEDLRADPLVAAVLSRFPGAEIVDVRGPKPPEEIAEDGGMDEEPQGDD
jgi:DNA polymerase-3 subunit gamma/tau